MTLALRDNYGRRLWDLGTGTGNIAWADIEDFKGTETQATAGRPQAISSLPGLTEMLGDFARGLFVSVEPSWPLRPAYLYELSLLYEPGTGTVTAVRTKTTTEWEGSSQISPAALLAEIRSSLGLNIADLARVVGVERPTIYAWMSGRSTPQKANALRVVRILDVAAHWQRRSDMPLGDRGRVPGPDERSIVDLMALDPLPVGLLEERLADAARHEAGSAAETRRASSDIREVARRHGIAARPRHDSQAEIDFLTRRPMGAEDS
jgi:DNA-binding transcriptional regulator YiaG